MAKGSEGHFDEVVSGPSLIQKRAEKNEEEHEFRRNAKRDAENAFGRNPHMAHRLFQRRATPADDVWHHSGRAKEHIHQKDRRDDRHCWAKRTTGGLKQQDQAREREPFVGVVCKATRIHDLVVKEIAIERDEGASDGHDPVLDRDIIPRAGFQRRIGHEGQENRKGQVDLAGIVNDRAGQNIVCQRRGQNDLKHRPDDRDDRQECANMTNRITGTCVR